jgi:NADPH:quinone reductase-like Zn-dependent oxidoreductase
MEALVLDAPNKTAVIKTIHIPTPSPTEILVQVHAIALNPVDALYVAQPLGTSGRVVGSDFAGTVHTLGSSIPPSANLHIGTRVAGFLQGACSVNERPGAFAEYLVVEWDLVWKVPTWISLEEAATVSLCALTATQGLFYRLGIKAPFQWEGDTTTERSEITDKVQQNPLRIFIHGASTSLGQYAAQLVRIAARANGRELLLFGTASPARHGLLKAAPYSYNDIFDYRDPNWAEDFLKSLDNEGVQYAIDCISEGDSVKKVAKTIAAEGSMAVFRSREGQAWETEEGELPFEPVYGAVWEGLGVEVQYQGMPTGLMVRKAFANQFAGLTVPASARARDFAVGFYEFLSNMAAKNSPLVMQPNIVRLMPGGLRRVVADGFALLGPGVMDERDTSRPEDYMKPVSAEKLVYRMEVEN